MSRLQVHIFQAWLKHVSLADPFFETFSHKLDIGMVYILYVYSYAVLAVVSVWILCHKHHIRSLPLVMLAYWISVHLKTRNALIVFNSLHAGYIFTCFVIMLTFQYSLFQKIVQEHYQSVKRFGSRSGPTFCRSWSESKLFAKVVSRWQKSPIAKKELQ